MPTFLRYLIGPELMWLTFVLTTVLAIRWSGAPLKKLDGVWLRLTTIVPLIGVPLTFALYCWPEIAHNWYLLRIWAACLVGGHYVLDKGLSAHSEGGPGVGTAYMVGILLVILMLLAGSIWYLIKSF